MQGTVERTVTVEVMERKVVVEHGNKTEVAVPKKIFVRPMPMRRWLQAFKNLSGILGALPNTQIDLDNPAQMAIWIMHVLGQVPDDVMALISLATDEPADFFDRIDLDEGVKVLIAVVQVNKDFFVHKVLPMLSELAPALKDKMESTFGQTQSAS